MIFGGWTTAVCKKHSIVFMISCPLCAQEHEKDSSMSKQQSTQIQFDPHTGEKLTGCHYAEKHRWFGRDWLYNPWTGEKRDQRDVASDAHGRLILPPSEPLYAAPALVADQDKRECPYADCDHPNSECAGKCAKPHATPSALDDQVAGDHYKKLGAYQPWEVLRRWLTPEEFRGFMKGSAIAYLARERDKGGSEDVAKAEHYLRALLELESRKP